MYHKLEDLFSKENKLSLEDYTKAIKEIAPWYASIKNESSIGENNLLKLNKAIENNYQYYECLCDLIDNGKINSETPNNDPIGLGVKSMILQNGENSYIYPFSINPHMPRSQSLGTIRKHSSLPMDFGVNFPGVYINLMDNNLLNKKKYLLDGNSALLDAIHYTYTIGAQQLIQNPQADINKYNLEYGYNPLLVAVTKGWNHTNPIFRAPQKAIIETLLERIDIDVNCIHLANGMTPLHIACLRRDFELIKKLLSKGANLEALTYQQQSPMDMLSVTYEDVQKIVTHLTKEKDHLEYIKSNSFTLLTHQEWDSNFESVKKLLNKYSSKHLQTNDTNTHNSIQKQTAIAKTSVYYREQLYSMRNEVPGTELDRVEASSITGSFMCS